MKRVNQKFSGSILWMLLLLAVFSCQKSQVHESVDNLPLQEEDCAKMSNGISADIVDLTGNDAAVVAEMFLCSSVATKTVGNMQVKNIVTISDRKGNPAIYAVNYEDGYVLVSATKNYYPVLAKIDHGNYSGNCGTGQDVIIGDYIQDIEYISENPSEKVSRTFWKTYEKCADCEPSDALTKVIDDDIYEIRNEFMSELRSRGYNVYLLKNKPEDMPDNIYDSYVSQGDLINRWGDDLNYLEIALIAEKHVSEFHQKNPLIQTHWHQRAPYNSSLDDPKQFLGCVTIAVGQIMKYFEYPNKYNWNDMPNDTTSVVLSDFLAGLRKDLWTTSGGGSNYINAMRVFRDNGYSCESKNHSSTDVISSLGKNRPVYMRGEDKTDKSAHAWVCDGYSYMYVYDEYALYFFDEQLYPRCEYVEIESSMDGLTSSRPYYHMNWGWRTGYDGWFLDLNISTSNGNFSSDRKDVIITGWK
ncbi:MAG: C10 family peptidase [Bacteroidales bacterium]|nr:C10 family peptidase [Bacteroidales bacterium]